MKSRRECNLNGIFSFELRRRQHRVEEVAAEFWRQKSLNRFSFPVFGRQRQQQLAPAEGLEHRRVEHGLEVDGRQLLLEAEDQCGKVFVKYLGRGGGKVVSILACTPKI